MGASRSSDWGADVSDGGSPSDPTSDPPSRPSPPDLPNPELSDSSKRLRTRRRGEDAQGAGAPRSLATASPPAMNGSAPRSQLSLPVPRATQTGSCDAGESDAWAGVGVPNVKTGGTTARAIRRPVTGSLAVPVPRKPPRPPRGLPFGAPTRESHHGAVSGEPSGTCATKGSTPPPTNRDTCCR